MATKVKGYAIKEGTIPLNALSSAVRDKIENVSFEEEAYNNDINLNYLKERKRYAWIKYIKVKSYGNNRK